MRSAHAWRRRLFAVVVPAVFSAGCALVAGVDFDSTKLSTNALTDAARNTEASERSDPDAGSGDLSPTSDASIDAPDAFDAKACDEDNDGFRSLACGGDDCDDKDPRTHPDSGWVHDPAVAPRFGDWDCSGTVEKGVPHVWTTCTGNSSICSGLSGFVADTPCGSMGRYNQCIIQGTGCTLDTTSTVTQVCR